jgi:hypothetical protein
MPVAVFAAASRASCTAYESFLGPGLRRDDDFQSDAPNYVLLTKPGIQHESSILRARFSLQRSRSGHPGAGRDPVQIKYSADSISVTYL